jgi:hypothetical protein
MEAMELHGRRILMKLDPRQMREQGLHLHLLKVRSHLSL